MAKKNVVNTLKEVADHFGVSTKSLSKWRQRPNWPCGSGPYDLDVIEKWRADTFRRRPEDDLVRSEKGAEFTSDQARLIKAKADREGAMAKLAQLEVLLKEGNYADLDDVNQFMAEFFTEFRRLLLRIPVDMVPSYNKSIRTNLREDIEERLKLVLNQMHDWVLKLEELRDEG